MADTDPVQESVNALSRFFVADATLGDTVQRVVELAGQAIPPAEMTGLTMLIEDRPTTAFFSDPTAPEIDQAQYDSGRGPCLDSFRQRKTFIIDLTSEDERWPEFSRAAAEHGILSTMSLSLHTGDRSLGALNFYARTGGAFSEESVQHGQVFADQAAIVLLNSQAYWDAQTVKERLVEAMQSRAVIEQAKGILIAQSKVDADAAFEILVRASQRENRKLRDIAAELVRAYVEGEGEGASG